MGNDGKGSTERLTVRYLDEIILLRKILACHLKKNSGNMKEEMMGIELYKKIDKHLKNNRILQ